MPRIRWPHLYLVLVGLDAAAACAGLWLNQRIVREHQASVSTGLAWSAIAADLDAVAAAADAVAAPLVAEAHLASARRPDREQLVASLVALNERLEGETNPVARALGPAALAPVGAAADRLWLAAGTAENTRLSAVAAASLLLSRELDMVRAQARLAHDRELEARSTRVARLRHLFHALVASALTITAVVAIYGMRLVSRFRRQDRQAAEVLAALEVSELRKAAVIGAALDAIIVMDQAGRITDFNPAAERIFGFSANDVVGREAIATIIPAPAREAYRRALARFIASGDARHLGRRVETAGLHADGSEFPVELTVTPARIGELTLFTAHVRDITERKEHENALRRSNRELEQFAYVASHDLQEPLRMISGYLALLDKRYRAAIDDKGREFITHAVDGAERMHALINGLLAYSRVDRGEAPQAMVDATAALDEALEYLRPKLLETGGEVVRDTLPSVLGDRVQLVQLFQNLVGNALKYRGAEAPRVRVSAEREGERWRITVRDNGIGIDPAYHERIFEIFQRLHTRAEYPGTGIGLAICKKIVERHGGRLWVESTKGSGSAFCFTLAAAGSGAFRLRRGDSARLRPAVDQSPSGR